MTVAHTLDALEEDVPLREDVSRLLAAAPAPALGPALRAGASQVACELARAWAGGRLPDGARVGPYTVEGVLGQGGQGIVYRARDDEGRAVALKVPRPELVSRLIREAQILFLLDHPRVVRIEKAAFEGVEVPYVATELARESLADRLARRPDGLCPEAVLQLADEVLEALAYAHSKGVVHRDLKPSNILFDARRSELKVADFGIGSLGLVAGRRVDGTLVSADRTVFAGTPAYMAPEQERIEAPVDGRADLYALGKVLSHTLTGRTPRTVQPLEGRVPGLPAGWDAFMFRLLEDRPADRFPSAEAARQALAALRERPVAPPPAAPAPAPVMLPAREDAHLPTASLRTLEAVVETVRLLRELRQGGILALTALPPGQRASGPVASPNHLLRGALRGAVVLERDRVVGTLPCVPGSPLPARAELATRLCAWGEAVVVLVQPDRQVSLGCYGRLRLLPDPEALHPALVALVAGAPSARLAAQASPAPQPVWPLPAAFALGGVAIGVCAQLSSFPAQLGVAALAGVLLGVAIWRLGPAEPRP